MARTVWCSDKISLKLPEAHAAAEQMMQMVHASGHKPDCKGCIQQEAGQSQASPSIENSVDSRTRLKEEKGASVTSPGPRTEQSTRELEPGMSAGPELMKLRQEFKNQEPDCAI